jgi:hypothetical protein
MLGREASVSERADSFVASLRSEDPVAERVAVNGLAARVERVAAPVREQVLGLLRREIVEMRLRPGQRLVERSRRRERSSRSRRRRRLPRCMRCVRCWRAPRRASS